MNDNLQQQLNALVSGDLPVADAVSAVSSLAAVYPYFVYPSVMLLKNYGDSLDDKDNREARQRIALVSADPTALYRLSAPEAGDFDRFYPPEQKAEMSTEDAISTFLETYGTSDDEETQLLERLIFNPVPDYGAVLEVESADSETPADTTSERIDSFLASHADRQTTTAQEPVSHGRNAAVKPVADSLLSESLAQIYIKQRRYDKAYEIISQLSLNYPEKSCYFADQLRFLRKLIINQQQKTKK